MQRNVMGSRQLPTYPNVSMPVTVPVQGYPQHVQQQAQQQNAIPTSTTNLMPPQTVPQSLSPRPASTGNYSLPPSLSPRPNSAGGMMDLSTTSNGYPQQAASPNDMGGQKGSPPAGSNAGRPNLRVVIPNPRGEVPQQHQSRTSNATLATPVVSLATPSNLGAGNFPSGLPTAFPSEFQLTSAAELHGLAGFNSPTLSAQWATQGPLSAAAQVTGLNQQGGSAANNGTPSSLSINTAMRHHQQHSQGMNIKSEPISPPRDSATPSSHQLRPSPSRQHMGHPGGGPGGPNAGHISPNPMTTHSNSSSPTGGEYDGPSLKRPRVGDWTS